MVFDVTAPTGLTKKEMIVVHRDEPLSKWYQWAVFDTASACEEKQDQLKNDFKDEYGYRKEHHQAPPAINMLKPDVKLQYETLLIAGQDSVCVASDDPRLAK